jgi:uncharacterized protein DUF5681
MTYDPTSASHDRSYDVGYGKPPLHTRFQKGQSGNPGGRPRGTERVKQLALDEAYREVAIDEDGEAGMMPAIQAVIRAQLALASKGNGPAQRAVLKMVQEIETERAAIEAMRPSRADAPHKPRRSGSPNAPAGCGRFRAIEPPSANAMPRPRGAPICDYPGAIRTPPVAAAGHLAVTSDFFQIPCSFPCSQGKAPTVIR